MTMYKQLVKGGTVDMEDLEAAFDENKLEYLTSSSSSPLANAIGKTFSAIQKDQSRLISLDVFRGLTVVLMVFVDNAGGILPSVNHSPWNGLTLADFVMPFFLFIVGVALGLAYKNVPCNTSATTKAIGRGLKLLVLGIFLQGGFFHGINKLTYGVDIGQIRWMGILQRIAIVYLVAAVCEIWLKSDDKVYSGATLLKRYKLQWVIASVLSAIYITLLYGLYVPDWEFESPVGTPVEPVKFMVKCGVRGNTGPACNAVGMIDRNLLGLAHLYRKSIYRRTKQCSINSPDYGPLPADAPAWCQAPFDPEGLLSSMMAIVTCLVGLHYGHIIVHFKESKKRIHLWMAPSLCLVLIGVSLDILGMHVNKPLYTFSYMCFTSGTAGILFTAIYLLVDVYGYRQPTALLEWIGSHALMIFVLVACNILPLILQGFYWKEPHNNFFRLIGVGHK